MTRLARILAAVAVLAGGLWSGTALAQAAGFVATVTSESTDLRRNANDGSPVLDTVLRGTKLPAFGLSPDKQWVRVRAPGGETVWVARVDVKVAKGTIAATPAPAPSRSGPTRTLGGEKKLAHVVVPKAKVHINATKSSPLLAVAEKNDEFEVGGFSRDKLWVNVRTNGRVGWIQKTDLRPGPAPKGVAVAKPTPKPRPTPKDSFNDPNDGFGDPNAGFSDGPIEPPPPRRRRGMATDMSVWVDAGIVLINEKVSSNEGHGYSLNAMGYGAGVKFERRMSGSIFLEGGYLGTSNQRIPAPDSSTTVFSTLHRIDVSGRYKFFLFNGDEEGPHISAMAGIQNYSFIVQPQNLSWFYSQIYNSGSVGVGGEYPFGDIRTWVDARYLVPVLASQRYGNGGAGGDGQSNTSGGYSFGLGARKVFYSGASLGLGYQGHFYDTQFSGTGKRGPNKVTGVRVQDSFQAITLTYARGF